MDRARILRRRLAVALLLAVSAVGVMLLFVFPLRTLLQQDRQIASTRNQTQQLSRQDAALKDRIAYLHSQAGIAAAAHDRFGWEWRGQTSYAVIPAAPVTTVPSSTTVPSTKGHSGQRK